MILSVVVLVVMMTLMLLTLLMSVTSVMTMTMVTVVVAIMAVMLRKMELTTTMMIDASVDADDAVEHLADVGARAITIMVVMTS